MNVWIVLNDAKITYLRNQILFLVYVDDTLITKNSGLVVLRVPAIGLNNHTWHETDAPATNSKEAEAQLTTKYTDLTRLNTFEQEKIRATIQPRIIILQSTYSFLLKLLLLCRLMQHRNRLLKFYFQFLATRKSEVPAKLDQCHRIIVVGNALSVVIG